MAFERLEPREAELLHEYEQQRADLNTILIDKSLYDEKAKQWCIQLAGKSLRVRELGGQIVGFINDSQDFLQRITSMEPHAAAAWTCIALLLPVSHPCFHCVFSIRGSKSWAEHWRVAFGIVVCFDWILWLNLYNPYQILDTQLR